MRLALVQKPLVSAYIPDVAERKVMVENAIRYSLPISCSFF